MGRRLILDTGVLVAVERGLLRLGDLVKTEDDVAVAAVSIAELRLGELLAAPAFRADMESFRSAVQRTAEIVPYDQGVAMAHAELLFAARRAGRRRGTHDAIIAATAQATGRILLTTDKAAHFADLAGISASLVETPTDPGATGR